MSGETGWPLCPQNCTPREEFFFSSNFTKPEDLTDLLLTGSRFWFQRVLLPVIVFIGVFGNGVTVVVLTRRRMRSSTNTYLTALAVSDLLYLIFVFTMSFEHYPNSEHYYLYWVFRPYFNWLVDAMTSTSIWLTVTFTVERYIAVCHPLHGRMLCTESRARIAIVFIYLFWILATASTPFEWEVDCFCSLDGDLVFGHIWSELGKNELYRAIFYRIWSITSVYLPLVLLLIFNTFLILAVHRSTRTRRQMTQRDNPSCTQNTENKITITLIAVVVLFLVCQTPATMVLIYHSLNPNPPYQQEKILRIYGNIANLLVVVNAAANFILYTALSAKYRRTLISTFFWRCARIRTPGHSSAQTPEFSRLGRGTSTMMTTIRDKESSLHSKSNKSGRTSPCESQRTINQT